MPAFKISNTNLPWFYMHLFSLFYQSHILPHTPATLPSLFSPSLSIYSWSEYFNHESISITPEIYHLKVSPFFLSYSIKDSLFSMNRCRFSSDEFWSI